MGVHDVKKLSIFDEFSGKNPQQNRPKGTWERVIIPTLRASYSRQGQESILATLVEIFFLDQ